MTSSYVSDTDLKPLEVQAAFSSVCSRISSRVSSGPDRPAVVNGDRSLTYAELEQRAGGLAARLNAAGIGTGCCVGLFLQRSVEFVVAAYAVLKAGAAYLPLDTATPRDRVEFVLSDADVAAVITDRGKAQQLPAGSWRTIVVDRSDAFDGDAQGGALFEPAADSLAYVIYTSGSTGRPKGVELTHANLVNLVDWHISAFDISYADHASHLASVGFDAAVWEIWPYLVAGASVHLADEATRRSPQLLRDWLVAQKVTVSFVPTALAEQLIHLSWPAQMALRTLLTGADVLHRRPPTGLPFQLVNNYGPTECTVVATSGLVEVQADGYGTPSIGRPIKNTTAFILDGALQPVAVGEPGELCLAGALVGRGYRNDPELTENRFVTVLVEGQPLRVYRTGDQVRLLDNGEIAFLGRLDKQVKIRGYRIEPAEVIVALDCFPGVSASAVVVARPDVADDTSEPELVSYVVAAEGTSFTAVDLRRFLSSRLPEYMVPAKFVAIDALPMTINGKLDEPALPPPRADNLLAGEELPGSGETGSVEQQIASMVEAMLDQSAINTQDNIFLIGGHSMLAMQLVSRIRQTFGVQLTLRQIFEKRTVAALAIEVMRQTSGGAGEDAP